MAEENQQPRANTDPKPNNEKKPGSVPILSPNLATVVCSYHAEKRIPLDALNKGADFIYGVIVALAISKAVESFLHGLSPNWFLDPLHVHLPLMSGIDYLAAGPGAEVKVRRLLQFSRLVIFMMTIIRFYFGSIIHLERKKMNSRSAGRHLIRSDG
jgi:hypothetical protein